MNIKIVPTAIKDLENVIAAERHVDNCNYIYQWTQEQHESALNDNNQRHYVIIDENNDFCGYIILDDVADASRSINFRRFVVTKKGQGIGKQAIDIIKRMVFTELKAHRLWLDVFTDNIPAYELYKKSGFRTEGTLVDSYLRQTGYASQHIMAILSTEYKTSN